MEKNWSKRMKLLNIGEHFEADRIHAQTLRSTRDRHKDLGRNYTVSISPANDKRVIIKRIK